MHYSYNIYYVKSNIYNNINVLNNNIDIISKLNLLLNEDD